MSPHEEALKAHASLRVSLGLGGLGVKSSRNTMLAGLFKNFKLRMSKLDPKGTPRVIESLKFYLSNYDSQKGGELPNIKDYAEYRIPNVVFWIMKSYMKWIMSIELTAEEQKLCREFAPSAGHAMGFTNDLYSWNVERHDQSDRQWNAVPVVIVQYGLDEDDAIVFIKSLAVQHEQGTRQLGTELQGN